MYVYTYVANYLDKTEGRGTWQVFSKFMVLFKITKIKGAMQQPIQVLSAIP